MPSFAELKAKASKVTNTGVEKIQGVRDRNTSVAMKKTNWDPYSGAPPPPPPPPAISTQNKPKALAALPPPPSRTGSSVASGSIASASPALASRAPSSSPAPPLPARGGSAKPPPPLPRRSNTLSAPPLPNRGGSRSPVASNSATDPSPTPSPAPVPPPPLPSRSPLPPPSRTSIQSTPPPLTNLASKPTASPASSFLAPSFSTRTPPPRKSPAPQPPLRVAKSEPEAGQDEIDWANLSEEDKQVFFSWLDEFFTRMLGVPIGPGKDGSFVHTGHHSEVQR